MSFFDLEVLKEKPIKSIGIMPHSKLSKNMLLDKKIEKKKQKLQLIRIYENMVKF
jgi:hypothetical protein